MVIKTKEKSLLESFNQHNETTGLISRSSRGLVAVSGGVDSVVLLDLLVNLQDSYDLTLTVAHFNHKIRGLASDKDESFTVSLAKKYGLRVFTCSLKNQQVESRESWEAFARRERYAFLTDLSDKKNYDWIATGHHTDDQVETILLRIIEGSGIQGLMGIRLKNGKIIRPLLPFSRKEIVKYAEDNNLSYRDDLSNRDLSIPRNYLRHRVIPLLKELNPNLAGTMSHLPEIAEEMDEVISADVGKLRKELIVETDFNRFAIDINRLEKEPMLIQKRLIFDLVTDTEGTSSWRRHIWDELSNFLESATTGEKLTLPNYWTLLMDRNRLLLHKEEVDISGREEKFPFFLKQHTKIDVDDHTFTIDRLNNYPEFNIDPNIEYIDISKLRDKKLNLRRWRPGDRMKPLGMTGFKKVSDILIDKKIDRFTKQEQYVLTAGRDIVWLCGVTLDDRFKVSSETQVIARIIWKNNNTVR